MHDYGTGYGFMPPTTHGLPSESLGRMPPPPAPPQIMPQPQHSHHQHLPALIMPNHPTWPSMLTNPHSHSYSAPPLPTPIMVPPLKTKLPASAPSNPRKTLTDDDRRRMCEYHMNNPHMKQQEIGNIFKVERSTVSKVLRQKDKYLNPENQPDSSAKRAKAKVPDVEKALANWLRNKQRNGLPVTDSEIRDQARIFLTSTGNADTTFKTNSSTWLEKFKQKNGIGAGRLTRRASETNIPDRAHLSVASPVLHASQSSATISPVSPARHTTSPSPLNTDKSDEGKESLDTFMDFASEPAGYKHANNQSSTSLSSAFTDTAPSSFSGSAISPTAPFTFSPDSNVGSFLPSDHGRDMGGGPGGAGPNFQRPRSQTFPTLDLEYMNQSPTGEPTTPKYSVSATAPSSALDSPANELAGGPALGIDHAITSPQLRHRSSNGSMAGRPVTTPVSAGGHGGGGGGGGGGVPSTTSGAAGSSPTSPTQEDARKAADTLLNFFHSAVPMGLSFDRNEYMAIVSLTEKLRIHQQQVAVAKAVMQGMGGLDRIPEGECEMGGAASVVTNSALKAEQP